MRGLVTWLAALSACLVDATQVDSTPKTLENLNVLQTVDIVSPYLKQSVDLQIENVASEPADDYVFLIPADLDTSLAKLLAKSTDGKALDIQKVEEPLVPGYASYRILFEKPLAPHEKFEFGVLLAFSSGSVPHPAEAKQSMSQWLKYEGTKNYVSYYDTRSQETQFNLVTDNYEVYEDGEEPSKPPVDSTGFLTFGPFTDVASLDSQSLTIRYENPLPQSHVENLNRSIWISHWGETVSFDESYDVHNLGTKLSSPFSRLDYSKPKVGFSLNNAAIRMLRVALPEGHREEYYVDLVGNVSTSVVTEKTSGHTLDVFPRYPVMGGWFYNFTVGWASELGNFVSKVGSSTYKLSVPLVGGPEKMSYGTVLNKIILPEGAELVEISSDRPMDELETSVTYSYLDLYGRPTIEIYYHNVVSENAEDIITISYEYPFVNVLRKPLSYTLAIFLLLLATKYTLSLYL